MPQLCYAMHVHIIFNFMLTLLSVIIMTQKNAIHRKENNYRSRCVMIPLSDFYECEIPKERMREGNCFILFL